MNESRPVISFEDAQLAAAALMRLVRGEEVESPLVSERAASAIIRLFQTQQRHTPDEVDRLAQRPNASQAVRDLSALSDAELAKRRWEMTADYRKERAGGVPPLG